MNGNSVDFTTVGEHFVEFAIEFFSLAKNKYHQQNRIKANSMAFQVLVSLEQPDRPSPTMSELASDMDITKQQLTKLVNTLEEKGLVQREHDSKNRRQVYLAITPDGLCIIGQLKAAMLNCTISGFSGYTEEELAELDHCLKRLSILLEKFNPDPEVKTLCSHFPDL